MTKTASRVASEYDSSVRAYFETPVIRGLRPAVDADDFLHPEINAKVGHPLCTETQWFGFYIPEEKVYGIQYISYRQNMKHVYGGTCVFQGMKSHQLAAEISDYRIFMNDDALLENDLHDVTLINGYRIEIIEPMKRHRARYRDDKLNNSFDIEYTAIMPAASYVETNHFEQAMKTRGEVVLRGKRYEVDGYHIRDRTWGEIRLEENVDSPPVDWMGCTFDDDFAFNIIALDDPDRHPIWEGHFDRPKKLVLGGWVWRDGEIVQVVSCSKLMRYDAQLRPSSFEFVMEDSKGRKYEVMGKVTAGVPFRVYWNVDAWAFMAEIECNGRKGTCDLQHIRWGKFVYALTQG